MPTATSSASLNSPLSLAYNPESHEFNLQISGVKSVSYLLEYSSENQDGKKIRHAINQGGPADDRGLYRQTILAGTQSSEDTFLHDVTGGNLQLLATLNNGSRDQYALEFTIDAQGKLQISSQTVTPANQAVQGESTPSALTTEDFLNPTLPASTIQTAHPAVPQAWYQRLFNRDNLMQSLPLVIGIGLFLVVLAAMIFIANRQRRDKIAFLDPR